MLNQLEPLAQGILDFWFGPMLVGRMQDIAKQQQWFKADAVFDKSLSRRYQEYLDPGFMGALDRWTHQDHGLVALIVLLDQFPRNIFRGTARAFAYDKKALSLAVLALEQDRYLRLPAVMAYFSLMPTMHSEQLEVQNLGIAAFTKLLAVTESAQRDLIEKALTYAEAHRAIIARFGRFPHRSLLLDRESTAEELVFLTEPGSSF